MRSNQLLQQRWSPYKVGGMLAILSWITFAFMGKALGTSTTMVRAVGGIERLVAPDHLEQTPYLTKYLGTSQSPKPVVEWQFALVLMLPVGALIAAKLSNDTINESVPDLWKARFGPSKQLRYTAAFLGGTILIIGARLAGGCTSGHGLSGGMQLSTSGWIFMAAMFAGGVPTAMLLYPKSLDSKAQTHKGEQS